MKKSAAILLLLTGIGIHAGNFADDCRRVETWIGKNYPVGSPARRMQTNRLQQIRRLQANDAEKSERLKRQFPKALGVQWRAELENAKSQGVLFSADNKTLIKCPENLSEIIIPGCVIAIGDRAFAGCRYLEIISFPASVISIGREAFSGCSSLTSVVIPENVTSIGEKAFSNCENLTGISIPDSVIRLGVGKVFDLEKLVSVEIADNVTEIREKAFAGCKNLQSVKIPSSVTSIGALAFAGCENLQSVKIPSSVTSIGICAFADCYNLRNFTIPAGVVKIGDGAFGGFYYPVKVAENNPVFMVDESGALLDAVDNRILFLPRSFQGHYEIPDGVISIAHGAFYACQDLTGITIPNGVDFIGAMAFSGCYKITDVTIPKGVIFIGDEAFSGCYNLASVTLPDTVTAIGNRVFDNCTNLTGIKIPPNVTSIGEKAFFGCKKLAGITIPDKVTIIGDCAFAGVKSLSVESGNLSFVYEDNGLLTKKRDRLLYVAPGVKYYAIPETVTEVNGAFAECIALRSVSVAPESTLKDMDVPENCSIIERVSVKGSSLEQITLANGVKLEMVRVEPGSFLMSKKDGHNHFSEIEHLKTLTKPFYIGKFEVTNAQWQAVTGEASPSESFKDGKYPVGGVSWFEAMRFCRLLNEKCKDVLGGKWQFTLPTEAQWEFAARGGNKSRGYKYSGSDKLKEVGRVCMSFSFKSPCPVGSFKANELGLYDMSGNVDEWCLDDYNEDARKCPAEFTRSYDDKSHSQRVIRGGCYASEDFFSRSSCRGNWSPYDERQTFGFRLALVPVQ